MKTDRKTLKMWARQILNGRYGTFIGAMMILYGISYAFSGAIQIIFMGQTAAAASILDTELAMIPVLITMLVLYMGLIVVMQLLTVGFAKMYLVTLNHEEPRLSYLFWAFQNHTWKFVGIALAVMGIVILWFLPVIVVTAGCAVSGEKGFLVAFLIIYELVSLVLLFWAALNWTLFYYILAENPEKKVLEALKESSRLMKGNRWRYFVLFLSFLGMELLGLLSFGIGMLWLTPYMGMTSALFYQDVKRTEPDVWDICE